MKWGMSRNLKPAEWTWGEWGALLEYYDPGKRRFSRLPEALRKAYHAYSNQMQLEELNRAVLAGKRTS